MLSEVLRYVDGLSTAGHLKLQVAPESAMNEPRFL